MRRGRFELGILESCSARAGRTVSEAWSQGAHGQAVPAPTPALFIFRSSPSPASSRTAGGQAAETLIPGLPSGWDLAAGDTVPAALPSLPGWLGDNHQGSHIGGRQSPGLVSCSPHRRVASSHEPQARASTL